MLHNRSSRLAVLLSLAVASPALAQSPSPPPKEPKTSAPAGAPGSPGPARPAPPKGGERAGKRRSPPEVTDLYNKSVDALRLNDPEKAIELLKECVKRDPRACVCIRALGVANSHPKVEHARAAIGYLQLYLDACHQEPDVEQFHQILASQPPRTPQELGRCNPEDAFTTVNPLPRRVGEMVRYNIEVNGLSMGVVDLKIERTGSFEGRPVIEYRAAFDIDSLVSTFMSFKGRASALVPLDSYLPVQAMNKWEAKDIERNEEIRFEKGNHWVTSLRSRAGRKNRRHRRYPTPAIDFLTAYYGVRALPRQAKGCVIFFNIGTAHTAWIEPDGEEQVRTPAGLKMADRYTLRYASELSKKAIDAKIWLSQGPDRLPYRALLQGTNTVDAKIHTYQPGRAE